MYERPVPIWPDKAKGLTIGLKKKKKSAIKLSIESSILQSFLN